MCPHASSASSAGAEQAEARFSAFISDSKFPCVGARSALNKGRIRYGHYAALGELDSARALREALINFSEEFQEPGAQPVSFVATFDSDVPDELAFEQLLWLQLRIMSELDRDSVAWDPTVSADPGSAEFSMSVAGRAYFVVGLHPAASRLARRSPMPCLVFNFHDQFEMLKASGKYAGMQDVIRARDTALQGSINPVLARFGDASEARQYSGRAVPAGWECPFMPASNDHV